MKIFCLQAGTLKRLEKLLSFYELINRTMKDKKHLLASVPIVHVPKDRCLLRFCLHSSEMILHAAEDQQMHQYSAKKHHFRKCNLRQHTTDIAP